MVSERFGLRVPLAEREAGKSRNREVITRGVAVVALGVIGAVFLGAYGNKVAGDRHTTTPTATRPADRADPSSNVEHGMLLQPLQLSAAKPRRVTPNTPKVHYAVLTVPCGRGGATERMSAVVDDLDEMRIGNGAKIGAVLVKRATKGPEATFTNTSPAVTVEDQTPFLGTGEDRTIKFTAQDPHTTLTFEVQNYADIHDVTVRTACTSDYTPVTSHHKTVATHSPHTGS